jgi:hypothetical protein
MKKIFLFAALGLIMLASCKKSSTGDVTTINTISAKLNGTLVTYTYEPNAESYLNNTNPLAYYFQGYTRDSSNTDNELYLSLDSYYKAFSARTYGNPGDSTSDAYFEVDSTSIWYGTASVTHPFIINITSFGSTVQGTFSGKVYPYQDTTQTPITITDGKFNLGL